MTDHSERGAVEIGFPGLDPDDRAEIRGALAELANQLETLTHLAFGRLPHSASRRQQDVGAPFVGMLGGTSPVNAAHVRIMLGSLAAADHVRAFVRATQDDRTTVAAANLTRGGVESAAKSWFLLTSESAADLVRRHIALAELELNYTIKHGQLMSSDGQETDGQEYLDAHRELLVDNGLEPCHGVTMTTLVTDLLNTAADDRSGRSAYSALSSAAHGEAVAVSMFLVAREGDVHLQLPAALAYEYTGLLHMSCRLVARQLIAYADLEREYAERWTAALERATIPMRAIQSRALTPDAIRAAVRARTAR